MTADGTPQAFEACRKAGAIYLLKPLPKQELLKALSSKATHSILKRSRSNEILDTSRLQEVDEVEVGLSIELLKDFVRDSAAPATYTGCS